VKGKPYGAAAVINAALQNSPQMILGNVAVKEVHPLERLLIYIY